jgi:hypothetical protein
MPVKKVVDPKRIIRKNGGPRRRRGTWGHWPKKWILKILFGSFSFAKTSNFASIGLSIMKTSLAH